MIQDQLDKLAAILTSPRADLRPNLRRRRPRLSAAALASLFALFAALAPAARAQAESAPAGAATPEPAAAEAVAEPAGDDEEPETMASFFGSTTVTATGRRTEAFEISTPVTVLSETTIERQAPDNAADLLRSQPGVDVNGVGPNQARPVIRGQRGLRVLFLQDGLRMNNPRRQTDFGEIPGLVDTDTLHSVEVVRGPASVLYGSDAIGGVLNLIPRSPSYRGAGSATGSLVLRHRSAGEQWKGQASADGRWYRTSLQVGVSSRRAADYEAPSGTFGEIRLTGDTPVVDTGIEDESAHLFFGRELGDSQELSLRWQRYRADQAGFGFVEPDALGTAEPFRIRILYPFQEFDRYVFGYVASALAAPAADSLEAKAYLQQNERQLANDIDIDIGPLFPGAPNSSVAADTLNQTSLDTLGLRGQAIKLAHGRHLVTYGAEFYRDESENTDSSVTTTTLRFPFPPFAVESVTTDEIANTPNATNESYGLFVQDEIEAGERFKLTLGARFQNVATRAEPTPGWDISGLDFDDDSLVGSASLVYALTDNLRLVGSYGTAFRAPNIVERLFNGPTPEGAGFQILNPDLSAEESENVEVGLKYLRANAVFELLLFRNDIDNGIIQHFLTPAEIAQLPPDLQARIAASRVRFVVQQQNVDRVRWEGAELVAGYRADNGFTVSANYTHLDGERSDPTNPPTGDTVTEKVNLELRWEPPRGRYWIEYRLRRNGAQPTVVDPGEPLPPIGPELPAFTVHNLSGGIDLPAPGRLEHSLTLVLENLSDELYAEFSNATFFRPQPGRNVTASYRVRF